MAHTVHNPVRWTYALTRSDDGNGSRGRAILYDRCKTLSTTVAHTVHNPVPWSYALTLSYDGHGSSCDNMIPLSQLHLTVLC